MSNRLKEIFEYKKHNFGKNTFGVGVIYCLITTGGAPIDIVTKYIENQGMK